MKPKTITCYECKGDGKVPYIHNGIEIWDICGTCSGEGTIPDPDDFENTLNDLVQAKEKSYEND